MTNYVPNNEGPCPCGYINECVIHCRHDDSGKFCPPMPKDEIKIESTEDAQKWINILHRRSIQDAEYYKEIFENIRQLRKPGWRRIFK